MQEIKEQSWLKKIPPVIGLILIIDVICIVLFMFNYLGAGALTRYGLLPRSEPLFMPLLLAPLLHGSWAHLWANLLPFTLLSWLASRYGSREYILLLLVVWFGGGLLLWCVGRPAYHIGLSGVIYGLWAYLLVYALMHRSFKALAIGAVVLVLYAVMWQGLIPGQLSGQWHVSVEGHLSGALVGGLYAYFCARRHKKRESENIHKNKSR